MAERTLLEDSISWYNARRSGDTYDAASLLQAIADLGSQQCCLYVAADPSQLVTTWVIDQNVTVPSTMTLYIPSGVGLQISAGKTLTVNGPLIAERKGWKSGSGTLTIASTVPSLQHGYMLPIMARYALAGLPTPDLRPGAMAGLTDAYGGFVVDAGDNWFSFPGGSINVMSDPFRAHPSKSAAANTTAIQSALDAASTYNMMVFLPAGTFQVNTLKIKNGCRGFYGPGTLQDNGVSGQGVLCLDGPNIYGGTAVTNCKVQANIDCSNGADRAIFADRAIDCDFVGCRITGMTDSASKYGILLYYGSYGCKISHNTIRFSSGTPTNNQYGIAVVSDTDAYGNYFAAATGFAGTTIATNAVHGLTIFGNTIYGGSHGISLNGVLRSSIFGNTIDTIRDRCVILEPSCRYIDIAGNTLTNFKSSAVHMSYGAGFVNVVGNQCFSTIANGESALQAYGGCHYINFDSNTVYVESGSPQGTGYGVYCGAEVQFSTIKNNHLTGFKLAGICLDSGWDSTLPAGATYSRPNTVAPPVGSAWTFANTQYNSITNNTIYNPAATATTAAIALNQIKDIGGTDYSLNNCVVFGNQVLGSSNTHYLFVSEETSGQLVNNKVADNKFVGASTSKFSFTRGRAHFNHCAGNEFLNSPESFATITGATPSVAYSDYVVCGNGGATTMTSLASGMRGQRVTLRLDANTTLQHAGGGNLRNNTNADITGDANDILVYINVDGTVWVQEQ